MPIYHLLAGVLFNILLRRNFKPGNTIYSVLFEFTNLIHWSIFYSHCDVDMRVNYQVSQFHITINPFSGIQKHVFSLNIHYIDGEVHEEERVMRVVSQLMIRAMYQLYGRSRGSGFIMDADFMGLRSVIDEAGSNVSTHHQLTNIVDQHIDLVDMIQHVLTSNFRRPINFN